MAEMLDTMTSMVNMVIAILAAIAGISLLVGGIGIMNIMLVSVTERTREIGIRKALGAREGIILRQFVIEAATTSALGGGLGIILGYLMSAVATQVIKRLMETAITVSPSATAVLAAFGISAGIGILFGYLPAKEPPASIPSKPCGMTDRRYLLYEIKSSLSHSGCVHALLAIGVPGLRSQRRQRSPDGPGFGYFGRHRSGKSCYPGGVFQNAGGSLLL